MGLETFNHFYKTSPFKHLLFWIVVLMFFTIAQIGNRPVDFPQLIFINLLNLAVPFVAAYIFNYFLMPYLYFRRKFVLFGLLFLIFAYIFSVSARIITVHLVEPITRTGDFLKEPIAEIFSNLSPLIYIYFPTIFVITLCMTLMNQIKTQASMKQRNLLLEKQKAESELRFLKMQINPHFLFNTLNNLYVLCLKKSEEAPNTVLRLSEILDYLLNNSERTKVSIADEIKLLQNYIGLEKLRYGNDLTVNFEKEIDDSTKNISPLLLLTLVENAFKHGAIDENPENTISIILKVKKNHLQFEITNTRKKFSEPKRLSKGIGLKNLQQQLEMSYQHFDLRISEEDIYFKVFLEIQLDSKIATNTNLQKTIAN